MVLGVLRLTLHLPESGSLKGKRQVVGGLLARVRRQFQVAAAEVGELERWQLAELAVACVSNDGRHADAVLGRVLDFVERTPLDARLAAVSTELISM